MVVVPNVRSNFGRSDAALLIWLLSRGEEQERDALETRLGEEGLDAILDDPRTFNAVLAGPAFSSASPEILFYLLVRHALLEDGLHDRLLADYLTALLLAFGKAKRAFSVQSDEKEFHHLVDLVAAGNEASARRAFLLRVHLGEFALWLSGLFPDHITARVRRRGAPGLAYYEELGSTGYRLAAKYSDAQAQGLSPVYQACADGFPALRTALNRIADRYLFPATGDRIERLLRQVADDFNRRSGPAEST